MKKYNTMSAAIEGAGLGYVEPIEDGEIHRFHVPLDSYGTENGWYVSYGTAGAFGSWKTGIKHKWSNGNLSAADRKAARARIKAAQIEKEAEREVSHQEAAQIAWNLWCRAEPVEYGSSGNHSYPLFKMFIPYETKVFGDWLLVPMYLDGVIVNLQKIDHFGTKRFLKGGRIKGCCMPIGELTDVLYICEGYATGCSIHEHTDDPVVVAFNAGNLKAVSLIVREQYPDAKIIIAADNDVRKDDSPNTGIVKAEEAAATIGASYIYPDFGNDTEGLTDFNDYLTAGGVM